MIDMHKLGTLLFSHKKCSVEELEEIAQQLKPDLFAQNPQVRGYIIINTCNRVEVYISADRPEEILEAVVEQLKLEKGGIFTGKDALEHLMRVACGLESMIVGEDQILGQIKKCYLESKKGGKLDELLDLAFDRAIKVAKRARQETRINEGSVSIGSAAVELAECITWGLEGKSILVIGAGEMGTLVARAISEKKLKAMFIANRTFERAKRLAEEVGGRAARLDENEKWLSCCDVAICTTSAPHYILNYEMMKRVMEHRKNRNVLYIIDIANPKDVEERVGKIEGIELYDLDSLYEISEENMKKRLSEVGKVERIIEEEIELFKKILAKHRVERLIGMIYKYGDRVRAEEKQKALRFMSTGRDLKLILDDFSHAVLAKTLHLPTEILRRYVVTNYLDDGALVEGDGVGGMKADFVDFFIDELEQELNINIQDQKLRRNNKPKPGTSKLCKDKD